GCRVPFCTQSQWFECPCHGSKYNRAGEYRDGPAPRGMDRFRVLVESGIVKVDTATRIDGPPRGTDTIQQQPEGPFCVTIGGE
ncbi:MAG TPA: Rieske 2Fe-2S domain-containing protein, partial [Actinomycetota bacterium]|nr:Rieske 2Fe-2S domain-containing protein [Actinomycetota bacterium]